MTSKVWVVQGSTGEYSDHIEWLVCGFSNEKSARELCERLSALGREAENQSREKTNSRHDWDEQPAGIELKSLDPKCYIDYTGLIYTAFEVEIRS